MRYANPPVCFTPHLTHITEQYPKELEVLRSGAGPVFCNQDRTHIVSAESQVQLPQAG